MFDERNSQPGCAGEILEVGKLYRLKQRYVFKSLNNDKKPTNLTEAFDSAQNKLRDFKPGQMLMYLGPAPDAWLIMRETFLSQDGEVVTPQTSFGRRISSFLEKQETTVAQDMV